MNLLKVLRLNSGKRNEEEEDLPIPVLYWSKPDTYEYESHG